MYIIEYQPPTAVNRWRHRRKIRKMGKDVTRYVAVPLVGLYLALAVLILLWTVDAIGEVVAVNEDSLLNIRAEPDVDASLRGALAGPRRLPAHGMGIRRIPKIKGPRWGADPVNIKIGCRPSCSLTV